MPDTWQCFVELGRIASDGHTRWHSMCAFSPTEQEAIDKAIKYLRTMLRYSRSDVKMAVRLATLQPGIRNEFALDDLPTGARIHELVVEESTDQDDMDCHRGGVG